MKTLKLVLAVAVLSLITFSCKNEKELETKTVEVETEVKNEIAADATIAKAEFNIEGMTCAMGCAKTIEKKLSKMEGVKSAKVDFEKKLAMVEYDEATVTPTSLEATVTKVGDAYTVNNMKTVESFSTNFAKKECSPDCKKEGCDHKKDQATSEGTKGEKQGCKDDCKKACCAKKA
jgi:Cu+-exporting ATPase